MSSRQLRKLQKQQELLKLQEAAEEKAKTSDDESEPEPEPEPVAAKPRVSLFAALGEEEDDDSDDGIKPDNKEEEGAKDGKEEPGNDQQVTAAKKNKKKKKKKKKGKQVEKDTLAEEETKPFDEDEEDEIDRALKELKIEKPTGNAAGASAAASARDTSLLRINPYYLKAVNEMKGLFGKETIEAAHQEEEAERQAALRKQYRARGVVQVDMETWLRGDPGQKLSEVTLRRNIFIQGRDYWPRNSAGGLSMVEVRPLADGSVEYAFVFNKEYDAIQSTFWRIVQTGNPGAMIHLLKASPYHVSTLLQVSSIAKRDQNQALATELCERALFTFGRITTTSFRSNLEQGKARLSFRRPENRQFWLTGYHYLKGLIRKGTFRTALEWVKLLLSMDEQDPYGLKHYIHILAIQAFQGQWLVDFCESSWCSKEPTSDDIYMAQSQVLAKLQLKDKEGARQLLQRGMKVLPWLYCSLYQALDLTAPRSVWGVVPTGTEVLWTKLYIHQAKDLWNTPQALALLKEEAAADGPKIPVDSARPPTRRCDLRTARLVFLDGATEVLSEVPRELLNASPNYESDPLPPPREENIFTSLSVQLQWAEGRQEAVIDRLFGQGMMARIDRALRNEAEFDEEDEAAAIAAAAAAGVGDNDADDRPDDTDPVPDDLEPLPAEANGQGTGRLLGMLRQWLNLQPTTGAGQADYESESDENSQVGLAPGAWPEEEEGPRRYQRPSVEDGEDEEDTEDDRVNTRGTR